VESERHTPRSGKLAISCAISSEQWIFFTWRTRRSRYGGGSKRSTRLLAKSPTSRASGLDVQRTKQITNVNQPSQTTGRNRCARASRRARQLTAAQAGTLLRTEQQ
jgi:hypothetical protein